MKNKLEETSEIWRKFNNTKREVRKPRGTD